LRRIAVSRMAGSNCHWLASPIEKGGSHPKCYALRNPLAQAARQSLSGALAIRVRGAVRLPDRIGWEVVLVSDWLWVSEWDAVCESLTDWVAAVPDETECESDAMLPCEALEKELYPPLTLATPGTPTDPPTFQPSP